MNIRLAGLAALACCVAGVAIARAEVDVIAIHKAGMDLQSAALGATNQALKAGVDVKSLANTGSAIAESGSSRQTDRGGQGRRQGSLHRRAQGGGAGLRCLPQHLPRQVASAQAGDRL